MRAINRLRKAGLTHTLMVDAANWGQDWEQIMLNDAPQVFCSDPQKNTIFSIHMYEAYNTHSVIDDYISTFVNQLKLPLVVGAFGADHQGEDVDEASIMELADYYQIGYLGWIWAGSGDSDYAQTSDIAIEFKVNDLSLWGDFLINSINGIRNSAEPASVFGTGHMNTDRSRTLPKTFNLKDSTNLVGCGDMNQLFRDSISGFD
jgi:mannan endo-1,4-beta-mannosidase